MTLRSAQPRGDLGFTLLELVVLVAIIAIVAAVGFETLAQRPAQARSTAIAFAELVAEARSLARVTGDPAQVGSTGATIGVVRDGAAYVATLYAGRPMLGERHSPIPAPNTPPLRTTTALTLGQSTVAAEPPFALFFSPSGHLSAHAPFAVGVDSPLAAEPACAIETGIIVAFLDGVHNQAHAISCEMARLDLDTTYPVGGRAGG